VACGMPRAGACRLVKSVPPDSLTTMETTQRRAVCAPGGGRYFAMLVERDSQPRIPRPVNEYGTAIFFEDNAGNYVGSAPLFHRIALWRVTDQEIGAMLQEALAKG
jgi:hypothetical protein